MGLNSIVTLKTLNMKNHYLSLLLIPLASLSLKAQVVFEYDEAGNQIYRGLKDGNKNTNTTPKSETKTLVSQANTIANKIKVAPVPVKTDLNVFWDKEITNYILKIDLLPYNAFNIIETINISNLKTNSYVFKMSHLTFGVYYLKFYLSDGSIYTVSVTKN